MHAIHWKCTHTISNDPKWFGVPPMYRGCFLVETDQMIRGRGYSFFPCGNFFFSFLTRNKCFVPLRHRNKQSFPPPSYNPIFLLVLWTKVLFVTFAEQTIFYSLCSEQSFFFSLPCPPPPVSFGHPLKPNMLCTRWPTAYSVDKCGFFFTTTVVFRLQCQCQRCISSRVSLVCSHFWRHGKHGDPHSGLFVVQSGSGWWGCGRVQSGETGGPDMRGL